MRVLFCTPSTALSGGIKVIFEVANRLRSRGLHTDLFSFAEGPQWFPVSAPLLPQKNLEEVDISSYDYIFLSNAFMVPMVLRHTSHPGLVFLAQDYESFHYGDGAIYADYVRRSPIFDRIYALPIPIIAISRSIQHLVKERAGRECYFVPLGIDKEIFQPQPRRPLGTPYRVLLVGNYLITHKGMRDGLEAVANLSKRYPMQLVLITQESRNRKLLESCGCPVEVHYCCPPEKVPAVMASCHAYCCTSWYEGFGLPAVEAFHCGLPVVSTRTMGVSDYGVDGENLLLAQPADPADLSQKLERILTDDGLRDRLIRGGFATVQERYHWDAAVDALLSVLAEIRSSPDASVVFDPDEMDGLLRDLESSGCLTPIGVFREFQNLAKRLDMVCDSVIARCECSIADEEELVRLRDRFAAHLANPSTQYYSAFKQKYDLCRLALSLCSEGGARHLELIRNRGRGNGRRDPSSLVEIRYTHA